MSASIGCEAADGMTSMYYIGKGVAEEANGFLRPVQHDPLRFTLRKFGVAGAVNTMTWAVEKDHPTLATLAWMANAVGKCYLASRNDRLARGVVR